MDRPERGDSELMVENEGFVSLRSLNARSVKPYL